MNEAVVDASVLVKWFKEENETQLEAARALNTRYERGELLIRVPPLLFIEILNIAARGMRWAAMDLEMLARQLDRHRFYVEQPPLVHVARWASRGLTAYDACYVALAEARRVPLITADERIVAVAPEVAQPLAGVS